MDDTLLFGSLLSNGIYSLYLQTFDEFDEKIALIHTMLEYYNYDKAVAQVKF
jgi:hypothetical protein